jgi:hypothetical protein
MKRFLAVLIASVFLASAAYAADETKGKGEEKKTEAKEKGKGEDKKAGAKGKSKGDDKKAPVAKDKSKSDEKPETK